MIIVAAICLLMVDAVVLTWAIGQPDIAKFIAVGAVLLTGGLFGHLMTRES